MQTLVLLQLFVDEFESLQEVLDLLIGDLAPLEKLIVYVLTLDVVLQGLVLLMLREQFLQVILLSKAQPLHQLYQQLALEEPCLGAARVIEVDELLIVREAEGALDHLQKILFLTVTLLGRVSDLHEAFVQVRLDIIQSDDVAVLILHSEQGLLELLMS